MFYILGFLIDIFAIALVVFLFANFCIYPAYKNFNLTHCGKSIQSYDEIKAITIPYVRIKDFLRRMNYDGILKQGYNVISIVEANDKNLAVDVHEQFKNKSFRYYINFSYWDFFRYYIDLKRHKTQIK